MKPATRRFMLTGFLTLLFCAGLFAQNTVSIQIKDAQGPVPGVNILIKGTTTGSMTDANGTTTLQVKPDDVLVVSCIGYATQEINVAGRSKIDLTIEPDSEELEETVVVGFGTQKKASLTSAITNINAEDITSTKQADLVASLQGKVPGLQIKQISGNSGFFDTDLSLRGYGEPLVIIDGVARQSNRKSGTWGGGNSQSSAAALASLNPEDIESISVLKDASASIYGIGAQNGVILITTKKGQIGKPSVSYSNILTFGYPTARPEEVDIVTYMQAYNEMAINSRKSAKFSDEFIQHYINGDAGYEDFDWYGSIMKKHNFNQVHNVSIRGGNQQTQYYLSGNYTGQQSLYKTENGTYHRYGITGNFTTKLTDALSVTFQTAINVTDNLNPPSNSLMNIFYYSMLAERTIPPTVLGDDTRYTDQPSAEHRNPLALLNPETGGYQKDLNAQFRNNLDIKYEAPFLKGLVLQASGAYDYTSIQSSSLTRTFALYDYWTGEYVNDNPDKNQYSETWNNYNKYYGRAQANYNTTFGGIHHFGATLAAEATLNKTKNISATREYGDFFTHDTISQGDASTATNSGTRYESANAGYVGRVNYDYKGKYLVEVMARYDGTYLYAQGHRWGFFPSYSLGWRVSDEPFFKAVFPKINNLKIRWSDGKTGMAQGSAYGYLLGYSTNGSWVFDDGGLLNGYASHSVAETLISWADVRMRDIGVDLEAWRGLFGASVDWFWRDITGIAATSSSTVPDFYGISLPQMNYNARQNVGIDLTLSHRNSIGAFNYRVQANATFSRVRPTYLKSEETAIYTSALNYYKNHSEGRWSNWNGATTYHWLDGTQFTSWQDIADSKVMYSEKNGQNNLLPGMYKLEDRDGDGYITSNDQYYDWSETNPPLQFGLTFSGRYKNFDFNMNWSGASLTNKTVSLSGGMGYGFFNTFFENYMDHWTLADGYTDPFDPQSQWVAGYWPAITLGTSAYDSSSNDGYRYNQPYTFVDGTYVRLKSIELGYTFSAKLLQRAHIRSLRIYANGTNLLTFCNKLLKPYDPERSQSSWLGVGGSPLMKNISCGVNINF